MTPKLLFHPKVTLTAGLTAVASFCALIGQISGVLPNVPIIGAHAVQITATASALGPVALWVATYGRSPASAVDNNQRPA